MYLKKESISVSCIKGVQIEKEVGEGSGCVYVYYYPTNRELTHYIEEDIWECKIGLSGDVKMRAKSLAMGYHEQPIIGLIIHTDYPSQLEKWLHNCLTEMRQNIPDSLGNEWFITSPKQVESLFTNEYISTKAKDIVKSRPNKARNIVKSRPNKDLETIKWPSVVKDLYKDSEWRLHHRLTKMGLTTKTQPITEYNLQINSLLCLDVAKSITDNKVKLEQPTWNEMTRELFERNVTLKEQPEENKKQNSVKTVQQARGSGFCGYLVVGKKSEQAVCYQTI